MQKLTSLLDKWFIAPHSSVTNPEKIQRSRLFSTMLLILILFLTFILIMVLTRDPEDISEPAVHGGFFLLGIGILMYLINKAGITRIPAMGIILPFIAIPIYISFWSGEDALFLAFLMIPIILTGIFYSLRWTMITSVGILLLVAILLYTINTSQEGLSYWNLRNMWFFLLMATGLFLSFIWHLGNLEQVRQQELKMINAELKQRIEERTEERRLNAELEKKNDELERFTYTVSHDLRAPLVTIRGFMGYLEKDLQTGNMERAKRDVDRIVRSADSMQSLLEKLLILSRAGQTIDKKESISFETIVQDSLNLVEGSIREKSVKVEIMSDLPTIQCDPTRLTQVLQNLIDNAVKFMGDQPDPTIKIGREGTDSEGNSIFYIRDNGIGIAPQNLDRVFGLFDKLDSQDEGAGIGLALVKRLIETHGGRIWVESEGLGKGSAFLFTIPGSRHTNE